MKFYVCSLIYPKIFKRLKKIVRIQYIIAATDPALSEIAVGPNTLSENMIFTINLTWHTPSGYCDVTFPSNMFGLTAIPDKAGSIPKSHFCFPVQN